MKKIIISLFSLAFVSCTFAANLYFTRGPKTLESGEAYSRAWENIINWSTVSPTGTESSDTSYNTARATALPAYGDRLTIGVYSGFSGTTQLYDSSKYVEVSSAVYASQIRHSGSYVTAGIKATSADASINLSLDGQFTNKNNTYGNVVIDNTQWDEHFHIAANVNLSSEVSGDMIIYNESASSNADAVKNLANKKNLYFDSGYTIEVKANSTDGKYNNLYLINARSDSVNGHQNYTGDLIINAKIKTGGNIMLGYDKNQSIVGEFTPGVIRFTGNKSNELSGTGLQLINQIVVESGMTDGAQLCSSAVQVMQGSTLRLIASDQIADGSSIQLKTPTTAGGIGGIFELNGFNERIGSLYLYNDSAATMLGIVDFGVNATEQVLWAANYRLGGKIIIDGSKLHVKNYVLGEDHFYITEKLTSEKMDTLVFDGYETGYEIVEKAITYDGASVYEYTLSQIPEPATAASLLGVFAVAFVLRRRFIRK